jgi:hypothetical protein
MVLKIGDFMYKSHLSKYYLPHVLCVLRTAHTRAARNNEKEGAARFFGSNRICGLVLHHRPSSRSRGMRLLLLLRVVSSLPLAMMPRSAAISCSA